MGGYPYVDIRGGNVIVLREIIRKNACASLFAQAFALWWILSYVTSWRIAEPSQRLHGAKLPKSLLFLAKDSLQDSISDFPFNTSLTHRDTRRARDFPFYLRNTQSTFP